ncbi:MAG: apolipoprotein N-acyltransferase [Spirochaetia bacterium]
MLKSIFITPYHGCFLAIFSAILLTLTLPNPIFPMGAGFLGVFALTPLFVAIYQSTKSRHAILYAFLFGLTNSLLSNFWLFFYKGFAWVTLGGASIGVGLLCMSTAGYLFALRKQPQLYRPFLVAMAWAFYETGKSNGFLGFPWGLIAYSTHSWLPFIQIVDIFGIVGMSFAMAFFNAFLAEWIIMWPRTSPQVFIKHLQFLLYMIVLFLSYGFVQLSEKSAPSTEKIKLLLVQQNNDPWAAEDNSLYLYQQIVERSLLRFGSDFDLIVGSEGILPYPYEKDLLFYEMMPNENYSFNAFIQNIQSHQIIGSPLSYSSEEEQNGVIFLDPGGQLLDIYAKRQLVPFAEYNPLLQNPLGYWFFDTVIGYPFSWVKGTSNTIFSLDLKNDRQILFGVPICYEDAFGWVPRALTFAGAQIFVNVTNNSWSKTISAQNQHLVAARYRSIENRRPLVRATTSGVTAYIDIHGRIVEELPQFVSASMRIEVPIPAKNRLTIYTLAGDWMAWAFVIFVHSYLLWHTYFFYQRASWKLPHLLKLGLYDAKLAAK